MAYAPTFRLSLWLGLLAYAPLGYAVLSRWGIVAPQSGWPAISPEQVVAYGAVLLGFFAGGRWGGAITRAERSPWPYLGGVAIAGLGAVALFSGNQLGLALLLVGFSAQGGWDVMSAYAGHWPHAIIGQRRLLAFLISLTLLALLLLG